MSNVKTFLRLFFYKNAFLFFQRFVGYLTNNARCNCMSLEETSFFQIL